MFGIIYIFLLCYLWWWTKMAKSERNYPDYALFISQRSIVKILISLLSVLYRQSNLAASHISFKFSQQRYFYADSSCFPSIFCFWI